MEIKCFNKQVTWSHASTTKRTPNNFFMSVSYYGRIPSEVLWIFLFTSLQSTKITFRNKFRLEFISNLTVTCPLKFFSVFFLLNFRSFSIFSASYEMKEKLLHLKRLLKSFPFFPRIIFDWNDESGWSMNWEVQLVLLFFFVVVERKCGELVNAGIMKKEHYANPNC